MDVVSISRKVTPETILAAYREGMFPMGDPRTGLITWHRPSPRAIIPLDRFHISRSLAHTLKLGRFEVTLNRAFGDVMDACAHRDDGSGTWITPKIRAAYVALHEQGHAGSVEIWVDGALAGGTYGVHIGGAFFAESKFHRVRDMSKVALAHLVMRLRERGYALLEVQYLTPHLAQFGTIEVTGREYRPMLDAALALDCTFP
ncbi:MAG: leucyl/phenylalanyl-tRNA--protein transferase [Bryobacteraceae bacterium]